MKYYDTYVNIGIATITILYILFAMIALKDIFAL